MIATEKKCSKCGDVKALSEFHCFKQSGDGHKASCKSCVLSYSQAYRKANPEKVRESKLRHLENLSPEAYEANKATNKRWRDANLDHVRAKCRENGARWRILNKEHVLSKSREKGAQRYAENPYKYRAKQAAWANANPAHAVARISELGDSYIAGTLGMKTAEAPPELIALKREQLTMHRMARELKQAAKPTKEAK